MVFSAFTGPGPRETLSEKDIEDLVQGASGGNKLDAIHKPAYEKLEKANWEPITKSKDGDKPIPVVSRVSADGPIYSASFENVSEVIALLEAAASKGITKGTHASRADETDKGAIMISKGELKRLGINVPEQQVSAAR